VLVNLVDPYEAKGSDSDPAVYLRFGATLAVLFPPDGPVIPNFDFTLLGLKFEL